MFRKFRVLILGILCLTPVAAQKSNVRLLYTDDFRLILHNDGTTELYDHRQADAETTNLGAKQPELVNQLSAQLKARVK